MFLDMKNFLTNDEITEKDLLDFIDENKDQLKVEYIDFKYALVNPQNLIELLGQLGIKEKRVLIPISLSKNNIQSSIYIKNETIVEYKD